MPSFSSSSLRSTTASSASSRNRSRYRRVLLLPLSVIRRVLLLQVPKRQLHCGYPIVLVLVLVHLFWTIHETLLVSQRRYRPTRTHNSIHVTPSHPLTPFYDATTTSITNTTTNSNYTDYTGVPRVFPVFVSATTQSLYPCGPLVAKDTFRSTRLPTQAGLLYVKQRTTVSTRCASITARIAQKMGKKVRKTNRTTSSSTSPDKDDDDDSTFCTARLNSSPQKARRYQRRSRTHSFLWSIVQEPVDRLITNYYRYATSIPRPPPPTTNTNAEGTTRSSHTKNHRQYEQQLTQHFQNYVLSHEYQDYGYYYRALAVERYVDPYETNPEYRHAAIAEIMQSYDFLGIAERIEESLVVFMLLLDLDLPDILYLAPPKATAAVTSTRRSDGNGRTIDSYELWTKTECRAIPSINTTDPTMIPLALKQWLYSEEFEVFIETDVMLYKAVNAALDATIAMLGRARVADAVEQLQAAQVLVEHQCGDGRHNQNKKGVRFPCSPTDGTYQHDHDCLLDNTNIGCGNSCLDEVGQMLSEVKEGNIVHPVGSW